MMKLPLLPLIDEVKPAQARTQLRKQRPEDELGSQVLQRWNGFGLHEAQCSSQPGSVHPSRQKPGYSVRGSGLPQDHIEFFRRNQTREIPFLCLMPLTLPSADAPFAREQAREARRFADSQQESQVQ